MATAHKTETHTVTSIQAKKVIQKAFQIKRPIFLWGAAGIGKSELVEEIALEMGGPVIDFRMAQVDQTDIRGIPFFNKESGKMEWASPVDMPDEGFASQYPAVILFLDEMNSAAPAVQAAAYQLILNRRIGTYKLPDNVVIIAAGNRDGDKGVTYRMPGPLANRFIHVEMRADFESWAEWAAKNNVHPDVIGYLSFAKSDLTTFDGSANVRSFATPRTWAFVSQLLQDDDTDDETLFTLIAGTVGEGIATKFMAHRKYSSKLPRPADILSGKVTTLEMREISAMYALGTSMAYELRDARVKETPDVFNDICNNFFAYMMDNFEAEITVMSVRMASKIHKVIFNPSKIASFKRFEEKYGKYINPR